MALNPLFKNKAGADWENSTNYSAPTKLKDVVASTPTTITTPKGGTTTNAIANAVANPVKQETIETKNITGTPNVIGGTDEVVKDTTSVQEVKPKEFTKAVDNSGMIKDQSAELINALKAQIQQSVNNKNMAIEKLPEQYQPLKNEASANASRNVISLQEMLANRGDRGGIANSTLSDARMGGQRNIANYEMQQKDQEASLKNDIANLVLEGNIQEAQVKSRELRDLVANATAMDNTNYQREQDAYSNALTERNTLLNQTNADRTYNTGVNQWNTINTQNQTQLGKENTRLNEQDKTLKTEKEQKQYADSIKGLGDQMDYQAEINKIINDGDTSNDWKISVLKQEREAKIQNKLQNEIATIGQYSNDYQAEINKRQPNDPLLPYLKTAQLQKIASLKANELNISEARQKQAMDLWVKMGVATPEIAAILGIPEGSQTSDYGVDRANINQSNASASAVLTNADVNSKDFQAKKDAGYYNKETKNNSTNLNTIIDNMDKLYLSKDPDTGKTSVVGDKISIESDILSQGLSDADTKKLYARYGIPLPK